ncbi:MAG: hypothetical protein EAZ60_29000 [Oscillatoriales cyanobacterium]|uniref:hypothetical protein n=1 Tax=unclassified Microcoleus TaxID=2642155 RepID=UPI001DEBC6E2|nr:MULTISPECIES: hypothetical protein [unclassified Microcoleus]MCC3461271.1 hypothetical protein [Microcoleus sp. PH2017_11_PCY_U_A]TAE81466.1 MAG: hypothetical protein EAZ83_15425 [Oscillatoriales cyanobacterium]MCC3531128.1 hypothetical protein [Microcoleus sp. PH2017_21_RUC_O_A]MCC3541835.1 hypothetical protein [Microcoleus sp. PH2017_22_RUC_O_B]MCC3560680.1 hypothetical protein [Microcoleus sp. PH2017_27_LUM_O_A]
MQTAIFQSGRSTKNKEEGRRKKEEGRRKKEKAPIKQEKLEKINLILLIRELCRRTQLVGCVIAQNYSIILPKN